MGSSLKDRGVYSKSYSSRKLFFFSRKYQERLKIAEYPVHIFDTSRATVSNLNIGIRILVQEHFLSLLVFPYFEQNTEQDTR